MRQMRDDLPQRLVVVKQLLYFLHLFRVILHCLVDLKRLLQQKTHLLRVFTRVSFEEQLLNGFEVGVASINL